MSDIDGADTLATVGHYFDPLWRISVALSPLERELLHRWWVRRLASVAHAGAATIVTTQNYSRLEHSLGVFALVAHFAPGDTNARVAALVHDIGHLPFSHSLRGSPASTAMPSAPTASARCTGFCRGTTSTRKRSSPSSMAGNLLRCRASRAD